MGWRLAIMKYNTGISASIRRYRNWYGLTQSDVSRVLGVNLAAVSKWETGRTRPDIDQLATLAQLFDVTEQELLHPSEIKWSPSQKTLLEAAGVMQGVKQM